MKLFEERLPKNWKWNDLGNLCDFVSGVTFDRTETVASPMEGFLPILRAGHIGDALNITDDLVWVPASRVSDVQLLRVGDIAMCMSSGSPAIVGKSAVVDKPFTGSMGAFCSIIRPKNPDQQKFVAYWLKSEGFWQWRDGQARGINIQNLRASQLKHIKIPRPPLAEQKRIAAILEKADRLRRLRRYAHEVSDGYLQAVFLEMFGDPVTNPRGWKIKPLGEVVKNLDSRRIPIKESDRASMQGSYPYYGATGIIDHLNDFIFDETMLLIAEDGKNLLHRNKPIAFMAYGKYWVNNHAHVVKGNGQAELLYLMASLNYRDISKFVTGIDQFKLNRSNLDIIPVQIPSLPLQQKFTQIVHKHERLRAQQREAERQAEHLFQTLLQRAFWGEI